MVIYCTKLSKRGKTFRVRIRVALGLATVPLDKGNGGSGNEIAYILGLFRHIKIQLDSETKESG